MKAIYEQHIDTQALIERLQELSEGETVPYAVLSEQIGRSVIGEARHNLISARNFIEREMGIFTDTVRNVGIKRISPGQVVQGAPRQTKRKLRSAANRLLKKLDRTEDAALSPEDLRQKRTEMALFGTIKHFTKDSVDKAIVQQIEDKPSLSIGSVLEIARKAKS